MNRIQKKCFVASCCLHGSLLVLLLVGPAFLSSKPKDSLPVLQVIPAMAVDKLLYGGGSPDAAPPAPKSEPPAPPAASVVPPPAPPPPAPEPPKPTPPPVPEPPPPAVKTPDLFAEPVKKKETKKAPPPKTTPKAVAKEPPKKDTTKAQTSKDRLFSEPVDPKAARDAAEKAKRAQAAREAKAREVGRALERVNTGLSAGISIEFGPGGPGSVAFANYSQIVKSIYDNAWIDPQDVTDESATVQASVTINRDGTVLSATVLKSSGIRAVDRSVQAALERVKFVARFPEGAKEERRTFTLNFNLKAKRLAG